MNEQTQYEVGFWQSWFSLQPCIEGWEKFKRGYKHGGLTTGLAAVSDLDRLWGAEHTYRVEMLIVLAEDADVDVRRTVAQNTQTPPEVLVKLAEDADVDVRLTVAQNTQTPPEVLVKLAARGFSVIEVSPSEGEK